MANQIEPAPKGMFNGWWPIYDYPLLQQWAAAGRAVSVGDHYRILGARFKHAALIRVHHVTTLEEYQDAVQAYRALSGRLRHPEYTSSCLFRGQSCDYGGAGYVESKPAAFRSNEMARDYLSSDLESGLGAEWRTWAAVIERVTAVKDESGGLYQFSDPEQPDRKVARGSSDKRLTARLTTNFELMALGMHYGFPTASLDVTPDDAVALWFALHTTTTDEQGALRYVPNGGEPGTAAGPSVYVYLQFDHRENPVVNLTKSEALRGRAHRPFVQSAWGLPFMAHGQSWMGDMDAQFGRVDSPATRWPSAVIKPIFPGEECERARVRYRTADLFPPDDPLYWALLDANAPRLARYAV